MLARFPLFIVSLAFSPFNSQAARRATWLCLQAGMRSPPRAGRFALMSPGFWLLFLTPPAPAQPLLLPVKPWQRAAPINSGVL